MILYPLHKKSMKKSKVAHITTAHPVFDTRIFHKQCVSLSQSGFEVFLIAQSERNMVEKNVSIISLPIPSNRFERMVMLGVRALYYALKLNADIYHFHDPEFLPFALMLKVFGKKVIYDVHEDYEASIEDNDRDWLNPKTTKSIARVFRVFEDFSAHFFDYIICATKEISRNFTKQKCVIINNYPLNGELWNNQFEFSKRKNEVVYIGAISYMRGITELIDAVELVNNKGYKTLLHLAGTFSPLEISHVISAKDDWRFVKYYGQIDRKDLVKLLETVKIGIVLFHPAKNHINSQPNKLFEYLSAGIPIIVSDFPLWRELVVESKCGLAVNPLDVKAIADAIIYLFEHPDQAAEMGKRGRSLICDKYNWDIESSKLTETYNKIL